MPWLSHTKFWYMHDSATACGRHGHRAPCMWVEGGRRGDSLSQVLPSFSKGEAIEYWWACFRIPTRTPMRFQIPYPSCVRPVFLSLEGCRIFTFFLGLCSFTICFCVSLWSFLFFFLSICLALIVPFSRKLIFSSPGGLVVLFIWSPAPYFSPSLPLSLSLSGPPGIISVFLIFPCFYLFVLFSCGFFNFVFKIARFHCYHTSKFQAPVSPRVFHDSALVLSSRWGVFCYHPEGKSLFEVSYAACTVSISPAFLLFSCW